LIIWAELLDSGRAMKALPRQESLRSLMSFILWFSLG